MKGFLHSYAYIVGTVYFKKHAHGFSTPPPVTLFNKYYNPTTTTLEQHRVWLEDIWQPCTLEQHRVWLEDIWQPCTLEQHRVWLEDIWQPCTLEQHRVWLEDIWQPCTLEQHRVWLEDIWQNIWDCIQFEDETIPSVHALYRHWKRVCWVIDMWHQANRNVGADESDRVWLDN